MNFHPGRLTLAAAGTVLLLIFCTWIETLLSNVVGVHRPYTILYLIPVAIGAALLGVRGGIGAAVLSVVLARIYLFNNHQHGAHLFLDFPNVGDSIEFCALLIGTMTVAAVTGRLRTALGDVRASRDSLNSLNSRLAETNNRLLDTEQAQRIFHRDMLQAATGGKLRLVEANEMPPADLASGPPRFTLDLLEPQDATNLRHNLKKMGEELGMDSSQLDDLSTGATEAATNAIKHGHGGLATIWTYPDAIIVQVKDRGEGIAPALLARATLEQGYSTRTSLGMGFFLMLQTSDTLVLATGNDGTSVLLRVAVLSQTADQESLLSRYVGI